MIKLFLATIFALFVSTVNADIKFTDDFETGDLTKTQNGFAWNPTPNPAIVDFNGSKVARFKFVASGAGGDAWSEMRFTLGNYYRDVWLQYDLFVPTGYKQRSPGGDKSFVHLWTDAYSAVNGIGGGFTSWSESSLSLDRVLSFNQYQPQNPHAYDETRNRPKAIDDSMIGKWTQITINVRAGTGAGDGRAMIWKDGVLAYELSANNKPSWFGINKFLYEAGKNNRFNNGYLFGWSNSGYDTETYLYIDNFKFSDTPLIAGQAAQPAPAPSPTTAEVWRVGYEDSPVKTLAIEPTDKRVLNGTKCGSLIAYVNHSGNNRAYMKISDNEAAICTKWSK